MFSLICALEQPAVLKHHAEQSAHVLARHVFGRNAVNENFAAVRFVKTHKQVDERGLARARRSDNGDFLSRFDLAVEVENNLLFGSVAEIDVTELDVALEVGYALVSRVGSLLGLFQKIENSFARRRSRLQGVGHRGKLLYGLIERPYVRYESHYARDKQHIVVFDCHHAAHKTYENVAYVCHRVHDGHHHAGQKLTFESA